MLVGKIFEKERDVKRLSFCGMEMEKEREGFQFFLPLR